MKKIKELNVILLLVGIIMLSLSMSLMQGAQNRLVIGIVILLSALIIGGTSKSIANDYILNNYLESKKQRNAKVDKKREDDVKRKSASRSNLIVSIILMIAVVIVFFVKINYILFTILIIASIFLQSCLNALLYIYYDKRIKEDKK